MAIWWIDTRSCNFIVLFVHKNTAIHKVESKFLIHKTTRSLSSHLKHLILYSNPHHLKKSKMPSGSSSTRKNPSTTKIENANIENLVASHLAIAIARAMAMARRNNVATLPKKKIVQEVGKAPPRQNVRTLELQRETQIDLIGLQVKSFRQMSWRRKI